MAFGIAVVGFCIGLGIESGLKAIARAMEAWSKK